MKSFVNSLVVMISVLILTACGGGATTSRDVASDFPNGIVSDPVGTNRAPVISGTPTTSVDEGSAYSFTPEVNDSDGDNLTFSVDNLPDWATFSTSTGRVSGTPGSDAAGIYSNLVISVSDGGLSASLPAYSIVVKDVPASPTNVVTSQLPERSPTLASLAVSGNDVVLSWLQTGLVPDGGYDVFIDGVDAGSQYRTQALTVTVSGLDLETSHCFVVESRYSNTDQRYPSNQLCTSASAPANQPPTISGNPPTTVIAGVEYSFTPSADDPDDDSLTFSVNNLPVWASFDSQTGAISGIPEENDVGIYSDILISVNDGEETISMTPFAVEVEAGQVSIGSLSLRWSAPATREDGTSLELSEIGGYFIYLGNTVDSMQVEVELSDGTTDSHTITNLQVGTYFAALKVYDMDGNSSDYSNAVQVTVSN